MTNAICPLSFHYRAVIKLTIHVVIHSTEDMQVLSLRGSFLSVIDKVVIGEWSLVE